MLGFGSSAIAETFTSKLRSKPVYRELVTESCKAHGETNLDSETVVNILHTKLIRDSFQNQSLTQAVAYRLDYERTSTLYTDAFLLSEYGKAEWLKNNRCN